MGENLITTSVSGRTDELECQYSSGTFDFNGHAFDHTDNWTVLSTEGDKPAPRFSHAAAVIGSKMVVVGGDSGHRLLDDTRCGHLTLRQNAGPAWKQKVNFRASSPDILESARSGHTVTTAGQVLFLFGGENSKGKKLNDLHMFDLKSSTWLPLSTMNFTAEFYLWADLWPKF
ncbi:Tip elongation aberrant protein 1 [Carex littledalei]|uniref:Tip elongation aberrant protein 1 n=1 Tax=Carex littledalei TaxID=544730 RepID=A0A833VV45_9POAL|nr:Tip elongation aberrant protein 1 [Carex littledalei]